MIASLLQKYRDARVPVEAHIYARGGHALQHGQPVEAATLKKWPERLAEWMTDNGILDPSKRPEDRASR